MPYGGKKPPPGCLSSPGANLTLYRTVRICVNFTRCVFCSLRERCTCRAHSRRPHAKYTKVCPHRRTALLSRRLRGLQWFPSAAARFRPPLSRRPFSGKRSCAAVLTDPSAPHLRRTCRAHSRIPPPCLKFYFSADLLHRAAQAVSCDKILSRARRRNNTQKSENNSNKAV